MSFFNISSDVVQRNYSKFGYTQNPFPTKGVVRPEVYVPREEVQDLQEALNKFVGGDASDDTGRFFAIEGRRGVGKSNLLQHINHELSRMPDLENKVAVHYTPSNLAGARHLAEGLLVAMDKQRISELLQKITKDESSDIVDPELWGTDLGRFIFSWLETTSSNQQSLDSIGSDMESKSQHAADFLVRWLSGHQTYSEERKAYNIWAKERVPTPIAIPFLRHIATLLRKYGILDRILLMIDEAEDIASMGKKGTPYAMVLKALVNQFNGGNLFVIIAGQEDSMSKLGGLFPSLMDRWKQVRLLPLENEEKALALANAYIEKYTMPDSTAEPRPSPLEIKSLYKDIPQPKTQRDLLNALHEYVENLAKENIS